jgi:hypothetical protein
MTVETVLDKCGTEQDQPNSAVAEHTQDEWHIVESECTRNERDQRELKFSEGRGKLMKE